VKGFTRARDAIPDMLRTVTPELLDGLAPTDARALRSRRDLKLINALMMNNVLVARELRRAFKDKPPKLIVEIGAGDGAFMLQVAERLPKWSALQALLIDRHNLLNPETAVGFRELGWRAQAVTIDVHAWLAQATRIVPDVIVANLFLHHFDTPVLTEIFRQVAQRTNLFIACEPRRSRVGLTGARMVRVIGCNDVTRHDAVASVHAGFVDKELSSMWPDPSGWTLREEAYGLFSHCFVAMRNPNPAPAADQTGA